MNSELQLPPFVYRILPWIAAFAFFKIGRAHV